LTIPFILLSGYAGTFADRNSKSNVVLQVRIAEVPIAIVAAIGFWTQNVWLTMTALLALACQSACFGPARFGMIPEIVDSRDLSRANGLINMMTKIAVIVMIKSTQKMMERFRQRGRPGRTSQSGDCPKTQVRAAAA
jgi:acyl-[acyl-carrier-protein]-phospholipid O-acyltransferase/long-chain-fatty-acid--[acyl-carrier-protein] ligase